MILLLEIKDSKADSLIVVLKSLLCVKLKPLSDGKALLMSEIR